MSAGEEKKKSGNTALLVAVAVAVALGGAVLWLQQRADKSKKDLDRSVEEFNELRDIKTDILQIQARAGGKQKPKTIDSSQDLVKFIDDKRTKNGIPDLGIKEEREIPWTGWKESPYILTIKKENAVPLTNFVNFLAEIERELPYFKSKSVSVTYEDGKMVWGTVTISFFKESK